MISEDIIELKHLKNILKKDKQDWENEKFDPDNKVCVKK